MDRVSKDTLLYQFRRGSERFKKLVYSHKSYHIEETDTLVDDDDLADDDPDWVDEDSDEVEVEDVIDEDVESNSDNSSTHEQGEDDDDEYTDMLINI